MSDDAYGPSNSLPAALANLDAALSELNPPWSYWNARKNAQAAQVKAYRDAILASPLDDSAKADGIDRLVGVVQTVFLDPAAPTSTASSDAKALRDTVLSAPRITGEVVKKAADDAQAKLDSWTSWSLGGLALVPVAVAVVAVFVGLALLAREKRPR